MKAGMLTVLVVLAVFLAGCTAESAPLSDLPGCISYQFQAQEFEPGISWASLLLLVLVAVLMAIALAYMASQLFHRPDWEALAKIELTQTLLGASMIFITFWFSSFSCAIAYEVAGGDTFQIADSYLYNLIFRDMIPTINSFWDISWSAQKMTVIMIGLFSCSVGICFTPFGGYGMAAYALDTFAGILAPITASLIMQRIALSFIQQFAFTYLLPLGFILKIIPLTRDAGAYIIAISLGLYIVFPLTYVFNAVVMTKVAIDPVGIYTVCSGAGGSELDSTFIAGPLCTSLATVGRILPQAVFLPAMNMVIVVAFTKSMAKIFARDYMLEG